MAQKALIISDDRVGHQTQSEAFCEILGFEFEILRVRFLFKWLKILSYIFDFFKIYLPIFSFKSPKFSAFDIVVSAGSSTYYANKFFARKFGAKNIALMQPKGFRGDFTLIFNTFNDVKFKDKNTITLPVNINLLRQKSYYTPQKKAIGFIIGGDNKIFKMSNEILNDIKKIRENFKSYEALLTTSARTPDEISRALKEQNFNFFVDFKSDKINPIYDFLTKCEFVFITQDSISMISEAVCNGSANVVILPLCAKNKDSKFHKFIANLKEQNFINFYNDDFKFNPTKKLNLYEILSKVKI